VGLLAQMDDISALLGRLLYGTSMRLIEGMRRRVKDVDFDRRVVIVREAKGNKDYGKQTGRRNAAALRCRMRWTSNTPSRAPLGHGFGCFLRQRCQ
jgi:integrase